MIERDPKIVQSDLSRTVISSTCSTASSQLKNESSPPATRRSPKNRRGRNIPRQGVRSRCSRGRLRDLPGWSLALASGSPRCILHRPCARAAEPQGCRGQSTSPRPRRCRRGIELGERRAQRSRRGAWENLSSLDGFGRRACAHHSTATAAAAIPGVVLCVADGIVRIAAGIIRAAARLSGGIDRLIGVTAGEEKRCDHDRDEPTSGAFVWSMRRGVGHHALRSQRWRSH